MVTGLILVAVFVVVIWVILRDPKTRPILFVTALILLGGTLFYHNVEGWSLLDSLYFCVVTLATIGFGDLAPKSDAGKAFTILYIFIGFGVIASFIRLIAQREAFGGRPRGRQRGMFAMLFGDDDDDDKEAPKVAHPAPPPAPLLPQDEDGEKHNPS